MAIQTKIAQPVFRPATRTGRRRNNIIGHAFGVGLDTSLSRPIQETNENSRVILGNVLTSEAQVTRGGDRRIIDGRPHVEGGNHLDMSVAANINAYWDIAPPSSLGYGVGFVFNAPDGTRKAVGNLSDDPTNQWYLSLFTSTANGYELVGRLGDSNNIQHFAGTLITGEWLFGYVEVTPTASNVYINGELVSTAAHAFSPITNASFTKFGIGDFRFTDHSFDWLGRVAGAIYLDTVLTADEHWNLYETLMRNKGGSLVIPQVESLKKLILCNERDGDVLLDAANSLSDQTSAMIDNYVSTCRKADADVPKQVANDQGCSLSFLNDTSSYFDPKLVVDPDGYELECWFTYKSTATWRGLAGVLQTTSQERAYLGVSLLHEMQYGHRDGLSIGSTLEDSKFYKAKLVTDGANYQGWIDSGSGFVDDTGGVQTKTGSAPTDPVLFGALNDEGVPTWHYSGLLHRVILRDSNGDVVSDTASDAWGALVGISVPILIPQNQVSKQAGTDVDIAGKSPDFAGSAPRDVVIEDSFQYDNALGHGATSVGGNITGAELNTWDSYYVRWRGRLTSDFGGGAAYLVGLSNVGNTLNRFPLYFAGSSKTVVGYITTTVGSISVATDDLTDLLDDGKNHVVEVDWRGNGTSMTISVDGVLHNSSVVINGVIAASDIDTSGYQLARFSPAAGAGAQHIHDDLKIGPSADDIKLHVPFSEGNGAILHDSVSGYTWEIQSYASSQWVTSADADARNAAEGFTFSRHFTSTGGSGYASIPDNTYFSGRGDFEVEFRMVQTGTATHYPILSAGSPNQFFIYAQSGSGKVAVHLNDTQVCLSNLTVYATDRKEHKYKITRVGSVVTLEIDDGTDVSVGSYGTALSTGADLMVARSGAVRSPMFIREFKLGPNGESGYYKFNESHREVVLQDHSGLGLHGTYVDWDHDEDDIVRIPATAAAGELLDAWGLELSNPGVNRRSDGVTNNEHEGTLDLGGQDYLGAASNAPFSKESEGHIETAADSYIRFDEDEFNAADYEILEFEWEFRRDALPAGQENLIDIETFVQAERLVLYANSSGELNLYDKTGTDTFSSFTEMWDGLWHRIKLRIDQTTGEANAWLDGALDPATATGLVTLPTTDLQYAVILGDRYATLYKATGDFRNIRWVWDGVEMLREPMFGTVVKKTVPATDSPLTFPRSNAPTARAFEAYQKVINSGFDVDRGPWTAPANATIANSLLTVASGISTNVIGQDVGFGVGDVVDWEIVVPSYTSGILKAYVGANNQVLSITSAGTYTGRTVITGTSPEYIWLAASGSAYLDVDSFKCWRINPVDSPRYVQTSESGEKRHIAYTPKPKYR